MLEGYLVIGLFKALYFKLFGIFELLVSLGQKNGLNRSKFFSQLSQLATLEDNSLAKVLADQNNGFIQGNLEVLRQFMKEYFPVFDSMERGSHIYLHSSMKVA
mmetsp:Transcript_44909/g.43484  ORF Transcript_44909/g.43484 Transcript_44909/m.43484 type:complete len:103 (-) Transcript_44909:196-504(-)